MKTLKRFRTYLFSFLLLAGLLLVACSLEEQLSESAGSEESLITKAVREYLIAQGAPADDIDVQIEEIDGGFARVHIISNDPVFLGSFTGFLQQVEGDWTTLLIGSGFNPEQVQSLGIPEQILPEGWILPVDLEPIDDSSNCPTPAAGIAAFASATHGYCLIYPESYVVEQPNPYETVLVIESLMNHTDPRVSITVEAANGRTAAQVVDGLLATLDTAVFDIERSETVIGGEEAIMLDNVPGQDINRQLFVVHEDILYHMMFTPFDASSTQAENLFGMVTGSLVFQTPLVLEPPAEGRSDHFAGLMADLAGAGGLIQETGEQIIQPFFAPAGQLVRLNGADLQIFEYQSAEAAAAEVALVAPDGGSVGSHMVTWMASPHFFNADRFIVLYVGDDVDVLTMLEAVLGSQFAGASQDSVGWVTNTSQRCNYSISYPPEMQVTDENAYSRTFGFKLDNPGGVARNFIYVSAIVPENRSLEAGSIYNYDPAEADILLGLQVGESKPSRDVANVVQWFTYQRLPDTPIGGHVAQTYENTQPWEFPDGTKEIRHYLSLNECTYLIGAYLDTAGSNQPGTISEELFNQIVATIRLTP